MLDSFLATRKTVRLADNIRVVCFEYANDVHTEFWFLILHLTIWLTAKQYGILTIWSPIKKIHFFNNPQAPNSP